MTGSPDGVFGTDGAKRMVELKIINPTKEIFKL
jgi:hypothetical protein